MEARALKKNIGSSPRKMRLMIDLIRGKNANEALNIMRFSANHASEDAYRTLLSAIHNLKNKDTESRLDEEQFYVKEVFVNQGPTMKRLSPAPMGRGYRIRKRSNHLTIVVSSK